MKAALALVLIYIGAFFVAIQGTTSNSVQAAQDTRTNATQPDQAKTIDPAKAADIRSLLELVGARDMIQDATNNSLKQIKERITENVTDSDRAQTIVNAFTAAYQKNYNPDDLMNQLVGIYDQHFTDEDIKGLLQFYGSPLGQKTAAEMPKINREILAAARAISNRAAREAWQQLKAENPGATQGVRPFAGRKRWQQGQQQGQRNGGQQAQSDTQQP
jgi:uncharacterized protein